MMSCKRGTFLINIFYFAGNQNAGDSDDTVLYLYRVSDDPQALFTVRWKICKFQRPRNFHLHVQVWFVEYLFLKIPHDCFINVNWSTIYF